MPSMTSAYCERVAAIALGLTLSAGCSGSGPDDPGTPAAVTVAAGQNQTGPVGQTLGSPLIVRVVTDKNRPVADQPVTFTVIGGGGSLSTRFDTTDQAGLAQTSWTLGTSTGAEQQVVASAFSSVTNSALAPALFTANVTAGAPASMQRLVGDGTAFINEVLGDSLGVVLSDLYGNPVSNAQVTWTVLAGGGQVSPASGATTAAGQARTRFTLGSGRNQTVRASSGGLSATFSFRGIERPSGTKVALPS